MSFTFLNQLPTPEEIKRNYPLTPELAELKKQRDAMISDVITYLIAIPSSPERIPVFSLSSDLAPQIMKILFATM